MSSSESESGVAVGETTGDTEVVGVTEVIGPTELVGATEIVGATDGATIADGAIGSGEMVGDWLHAGIAAISAHRQISNLVFIVILWE